LKEDRDVAERTAGYTPGPWHAGEAHIGNRVYDLNHFMVAEAHGSTQMIRANALLVAAAPELLETLKDALERLEASDPPHGGATWQVIQECYKVIRKVVPDYA
jgi:hypothetical protein